MAFYKKSDTTCWYMVLLSYYISSEELQEHCSSDENMFFTWVAQSRDHWWIVIQYIIYSAGFYMKY